MVREKINYLKESIDKRILSIDKKSSYHRRKAFNIFLLTSILSAIITILLGLKIADLNEFVRLTALVLTTIITVLNAYNAFFNNKELWVANNEARNKLYKLKFDIEYAEQDGTLSDEIADNFKFNYQEIFNDLNGTWRKNRIPPKLK